MENRPASTERRPAPRRRSPIRCCRCPPLTPSCDPLRDAKPSARSPLSGISLGVDREHADIPCARRAPGGIASAVQTPTSREMATASGIPPAPRRREPSPFAAAPGRPARRRIQRISQLLSAGGGQLVIISGSAPRGSGGLTGDLPGPHLHSRSNAVEANHDRCVLYLFPSHSAGSRSAVESRATQTDWP